MLENTNSLNFFCNAATCKSADLIVSALGSSQPVLAARDAAQEGAPTLAPADRRCLY